MVLLFAFMEVTIQSFSIIYLSIYLPIICVSVNQSSIYYHLSSYHLSHLSIISLYLFHIQKF
jgi:hypothetical protein